MLTKNDLHAAPTRRIIKLYRNGMTTYQIADEVALTQSRVSQVLRQYGVETRPTVSTRARGPAFAAHGRQTRAI
jgi:hypothetical protein